MGFSRQECCSGLPFPSPRFVKLSTLTHSSWVALHSLTHGFMELHKAMIHVVILVSFLDCGFDSGDGGIVVLVCSIFPLMEEKRLVQPS